MVKVSVSALTVTPLFVGLTRPAMLFGVTQTFWVFSSVPCWMFFIVTVKPIFTLLMMFSFYLLGFLGTCYDPFLFTIVLGRLERISRHQFYWGCNSYDPS